MSMQDNLPHLPEILPADVPVEMPDIPARLVIRSAADIKAAFDPLRGRILQVLRDHPMTSKQLADHFAIAPSLMTYHLQVLEAAGFVQIVAQRLIHGIVAKYYARTAQIFILEPPRELRDESPVQLSLMNQAHDELLETLPSLGEQEVLGAWFPHARLSRERMRSYEQRLNALVQDFLNESPDPEGELYALFAITFRAPLSLQHREA